MDALIQNPEIRRTKKGVIVPHHLPLEEGSKFIELVRHLAQKAGVELTLFPPDNLPANALWKKNQLITPALLGDLNELKSKLEHGELSEMAKSYWNQLYQAGQVQTSVHPIYVGPWFHEGDLRRQDSLSRTWLEDLLVSRMIYCMGGSQGNNVVEFKKGFEIPSAKAAIESAIMMSRCLDLAGVHFGFSDTKDDAMHEILGFKRKRVLNTK